MSKKKKEVELQEHRAIVSLPKSAVMIDITCTLLDENNDTYSARKTLATDEVWDAFRRAGDGYIYDEDAPHAVPMNDGDDLALIYLPEGAVFAQFECRCIEKTDHSEKVKRALNIVDIKRAFEYADADYIDEDDRFVITEAGKKFLEELGSTIA